MANDWESNKEQFIEFKVNQALDLCKEIEDSVASPIERIVLLYLHAVFSIGITKRTTLLESQKQIGIYKADIYFQKQTEDGIIHKIVIECDGHEFHEKTKKQAEHDKKRDRFMRTEGYTVLRYTGSEIVNDTNLVVQDIFKLTQKS